MKHITKPKVCYSLLPKWIHWYINYRPTSLLQLFGISTITY